MGFGFEGHGLWESHDILYNVGVLAEDLQARGNLNVIIIPCLQFILAFAFSFRIQSFIWCYMEGLLEQICSPSQMLWNREGQQKYLPRTSCVPYEDSCLRYIGQDCKAKCKISVFRFVPRTDSSLRTFTSVFNNSSHMLQNVRYPSCYPGNNICCKQFANS